MLGFINLNKPAGITSHGAADKIKKLTGIHRVGHAGTLDPFATGVLVIALGKATKLVEFLRCDNKEYEAVICLGATSDTYDGTGQITETPPPVPIPSGAQINSLLQQFTGEITQQPPKYSAIKVKGTPAYKLARRGQEVELAPRQVTIHTIKLIEYRSPLITIRVSCSAGTYIRSLAYDIGRRLKTGAYLAALHRTRAGNFAAKDSVDLAALTKDNWKEYLLPAVYSIPEMTKHQVTAAEADRVKRGLKVKVSAPLPTGNVAILSPKDELLAIGQYEPATGQLKPTKVIVEAEGNSKIKNQNSSQI
jgi:tRNA pseudouridine55 synthase